MKLSIKNLSKYITNQLQKDPIPVEDHILDLVHFIRWMRAENIPAYENDTLSQQMKNMFK